MTDLTPIEGITAFSAQRAVNTHGGAVMDQTGFQRITRIGVFGVFLAFLPISVSVAPGQSGLERPPMPVGDVPPSKAPAEPGSLDKLLDMADKDLGQLSQVRVAGATGSVSLDMPVSSVSRQESTVGKSPAAVFVITNEMIRRSGALSIPEVLRMAPGVEVARIDSSRYAISIRGFNSRFSNKLLVQIDGRSVYTPLFGGVFWDAQDVVLEDVEQIEVIRGPGATVWGANAVNGIINIITKNASETQGVYVQAGGGTYEHGFTTGRYGGRMGKDTSYRVYGKWFDRGSGGATPGAPPGENIDDFHQGRGGFRTDWTASEQDTVTLQGDCYRDLAGSFGVRPSMTPPTFIQSGSDPEQASGQNIVCRWTHKIDDESEWSLQSYFDHTERDWLEMDFGEKRNTADVDFCHHFPLADRHKMTWGLQYRNTGDKIRNAPFMLSFTPAERNINLYSCFVQDEITLSENRWYLTIGSKFEHNDFSGFEYQPTIRLLWTPSPKYSLWGAISRAVRIPTRADQNIRIVVPPVATSPVPVFPLILGQSGFKSEEELAYEVGIRGQPTEELAWDLAVFYNDYSKLRGRTFYPPILGYPTYFPAVLANVYEAKTYGFELASSCQMTERWKLSTAYSFLCEDGLPADYADGNDPRNQVYLQSGWDLGCHWELDMIWRYVDSLMYAEVAAYNVMDVRLAWRPRQHFEVGVVGRNLLSSGHTEFAANPMLVSLPTEVLPEVYGYVTWRY